MTLRQDAVEVCNDVVDWIARRPKRPSSKSGVIEWRWDRDEMKWYDPYPHTTARKLGRNTIKKYDDSEPEISRREKRVAMRRLKELSR